VEQDTLFSKKTLTLGGDVIDLTTPICMGILNITPDSFYEKSRKSGDAIIAQAGQYLEEGASILDVGGYSSRPGAEHISLEEELQRVIPAVRNIISHFPGTHISIDTFRAEVASAAIEEGADMVNDITGGEGDPDMFNLVASKNVGYVLMHMRGTPQTMKNLTDYSNLLEEITEYFRSRISVLDKLNVNKIVIDPGIGFAKTADQSFEIIKNLRIFDILKKPVLVGVSRKSLIQKILGNTSGDALNGTTVLNTVALLNGASILRVHDVKYAMEAIKLVKEL
jgi:dihydropteroate synthase